MVSSISSASPATLYQQITSQGLVLPGSSSSTPSQNTSQTQNDLAAISEVQAAPQILQAQARNWASAEISNLLTVLHVTMEADPSSAQGVLQVAQSISSAAQDIVAGDSSSTASTAPLSTGSGSSGVQANVSLLNLQETQSITVASVSTNGNQGSASLVTETENFSLQIESESIASGTAAGSPIDGEDPAPPSAGQIASDLNIVGEAYQALGQAQNALQSDTQGQPIQDYLQNSFDGADRTVHNSLNGLLTDFAAALTGAPLAPITSAVTSSLNLIA